MERGVGAASLPPWVRHGSVAIWARYRDWSTRCVLPQGEVRGGCRSAAMMVLAIALGASGCSSIDGLFDSSPSAPESTGSGGSSPFRDRVNALFFGSPAKTAEATPGAAAASAPQNVECPGVDIRSGASTISIGAPDAEPNPTTLRYQLSIAQTARECAVLGANMTIKVGVQGRVLLGPLGGPGQVEAPIRLALVQEGVEPKTIWTKLYRIPVTIPPGQTNTPFVHVEENMTFPTPKPAVLEAYVVYVGFDPAGLSAPEKKKAQKKPRASR
jgi:hypothetical protein